GTSLAAGIYGLVSQSQMNAGTAEVDSLIIGFRAAVVLVVVTSVIGLIIAIRAYSARKPQQPQASASQDVVPGAVAEVMKSEVYSINADSTVLEALYRFTSLGISGAPIVDHNNQLVEIGRAHV